MRARLRGFMLTGLATALLAGPAVGQEKVDYVVNLNRVMYTQQLRPLIDECNELGSLELLRGELEKLNSMTILGSSLSAFGIEVFTNCPPGYSGRGITPKSEMAQKKPPLLQHLFRGQPLSQELDGYDFTLEDVENGCEVYKYSKKYGEMECDSDLDPVEEGCEVYFYNAKQGEVDCGGSGLRPVEQACTAYLYSEDYAELSC